MIEQYPKDIVAQSKKKRIYLVVVNNNKDHRPVLTYATRLAYLNHGSVGLVCVRGNPDFSHWGGVENRIQKELLDESEKLAWEYAGFVRDLAPVPCCFFMDQGDVKDVIINIIDENVDHIKLLMLSADTKGSHGPGPLVSYFSGKGLKQLKIPLVLVPDDMDTTYYDLNLEENIED